MYQKWRTIFIMALFCIFLTGLGCSRHNQAQSDEIIIALDWVPNTNHTGLYVAQELGYFAEEGLQVKIVQPSEDSAATLVANNRADFGVYFQPNLPKRLNKKEPIVAVAAIMQHNTAGLLSLQSLGAKTPKDLHGKRYSTWEDEVDDATVAALVGEPLQKIPGESTDAATALQMNVFDYILVYYGWDGVHAQIKNIPTQFFYLKEYHPAFDYYSPILIANSQKITENTARYQKALSAIQKGYLYAAKNPEQSAQILVKHAPEINMELALASQHFISQHYLDEQGNWGTIDPKRWNVFFDWVNENKLTEHPIAQNAGLYLELLP